jgi:hypothetical protein
MVPASTFAVLLAGNFLGAVMKGACGGWFYAVC